MRPPFFNDLEIRLLYRIEQGTTTAATLTPRNYGERIKLEHLPAPRHEEINREEALNILTSRLTDLMERRARKGEGG